MTKGKRAPCGSTRLGHRIAHKLGIYQLSRCWASIGELSTEEFRKGFENITDKGNGNMSEVKRHYIADESLGGIEREYVEVERKADVGDYVYAVVFDEPYGQGRSEFIGTLTGYDEYNDALIKRLVDGVYLDIVEEDGDCIVTLSPTNIIRHHGQRYEMVDRKAKVGEEIITLKYAGWTDSVKPGVIMAVTDSEDDGSIETEKAYFSKDFNDEYRVLVPLSDEPSSDPTAPQSPQSTDDIIANLVERLYKAERKIDSQSEMIVHHRRRIIELEDKVDHNTDNIRTWAEDYSEHKAEESTTITQNFTIPNDEETVEKIARALAKRMAQSELRRGVR